jgi:Ca-activated chloride channel homolog
MKLRLLISLSLLLLSWQKVRAQLAPADDFFNTGAQLYISNNIPLALTNVETGLKLYPDDEKLKKLEELLKQQQKQNQQQQQNQKNQQQQNQSQQSKSDDQKNQQNQNQQSQKDQSSQKQDQQNQSDQKKDDGQKQQPDQKPADEKKDGDQKQPEKSDEKKDDKNAQGQPVAAGQMTPEEAKRLLDQQKGNEQVLQMKPQAKPPDTLHPVKDW